jgi:hypothetical protein
MPIFASETIKGRPLTSGVAPDVIVMDDLGIRDATGRYIGAAYHHNWPLLVGSISSFIWHCHEGLWQLNSVSEQHTVVGGSGASVTLVACPQAVAIGSGTAQLTAVLDLTVTAPAYRFGTVVAAPYTFSRGDAMAVLFAGTLTGLVGNLTYIMKRVG